MLYEFAWCKIAGCTEDEYTHVGYPTCYDKETGDPICEFCADSAEELEGEVCSFDRVKNGKDEWLKKKSKICG